MARGSTLINLLTKFRSEAKVSSNPAHNNQVRDSQVNLLQRVQEWLWEDFTWPHLRVERTFPLEAGQRYFDVPEDLDIDRIEKIEIKDCGTWRRLDAGIDGCHYTAFDSALDERSWPVQRWKISEGAAEEGEQIEVWPIPDQDGDATTLDGYVKVTGIRRLKPLVADGDRADLDDRLITLYAASEELAGSNAKLSQLKLAQANKLYAKLRSGLTPRRKFKMFSDSDKPPILRGPPSIYYRTVP
jgi:hypothetical protein